MAVKEVSRVLQDDWMVVERFGRQEQILENFEKLVLVGSYGTEVDKGSYRPKMDRTQREKAN